MAKPKTYRKFLLQPGLYNVKGKDGKRRPVELTEERLKHWADTVNAMNEDGLLIPVPYEHDLEQRPFSQRELATVATAGFWKRAEFDETTKKLNVVIEAATDEDAKNIGTRLKALSIYTEPNYIDPNGKEWRDAPLHLALTNQPMAVHKGEDAEWSELPEDALAICMSDMVGENQIEDLSTLVELLKRVAKIALPEGVQPNTLVSSLMSALAQKELSEAGGSQMVDLTKPPMGSETVPGPVLMSEVDMSKELEEKVRQLEELNASLRATLLGQKKSGMEGRINALVEGEVIMSDFASSLKAEVGAMTEEQALIVEAKLSALEAVPKPKKVPTVHDSQKGAVLMSASSPDGSFVPNPLDADGELSDEKFEEILKLVTPSLASL